MPSEVPKYHKIQDVPFEEATILKFNHPEQVSLNFLRRMLREIRPKNSCAQDSFSDFLFTLNLNLQKFVDLYQRIFELVHVILIIK